ncbi:MAG TPA: hypothetical protein VFW00_13440, partial [Rhodocyclaceae bacterium]|nr:hypothetical protein [Rhodocyclaceae bacterium]
FVTFPAAWCADDASWIRLANAKGILTLPGGCVQWRQSERNVTAGKSPYVTEKTEAMLMYMSWLIIHFQNESPEKIAALQREYHNWFFKLLGIMNPALGPARMIRLARALTKPLKTNLLKVGMSLAKNEYLAIRSIVKQFLRQLWEIPV